MPERCKEIAEQARMHVNCSSYLKHQMVYWNPVVRSDEQGKGLGVWGVAKFGDEDKVGVGIQNGECVSGKDVEFERGFNIPEGGKASDSSEACAKFLAKFYPGHTSRCWFSGRLDWETPL